MDCRYNLLPCRYGQRRDWWHCAIFSGMEWGAQKVSLAGIVMSQTNILVLVPAYSAYNKNVIEGVMACARNQPDTKVYVWDEWPVRNSSLPTKAIADIQRFNIHGILSDIWSERTLRVLQQIDLPVVDYGGTWPIEEVASVHVDNEAVGRLAAQHLLEKGLRHFGFWGKPFPQHSRERCNAFISEIQNAGFECSVFNRDVTAVPCPERIEKPAQKWLMSLPKPVGIMCWFDWQAVVAQYICRIAGLSIPDQIAMVGVDNDDIWRLQCPEPLTSIETNPHAIGHHAMELVLRMIQTGCQVSQPILIPPGGICMRRSTDITLDEDDGLANALRFIRDHADQSINVQDVLRAVPISRRHLEIQCRKTLHRTPREQIQHVHIERAKILLERYDLSIGQVAAMSGFTSAATFTTVFKRLVGCTPKEHRTVVQGA